MSFLESKSKWTPMTPQKPRSQSLTMEACGAWTNSKNFYRTSYGDMTRSVSPPQCSVTDYLFFPRDHRLPKLPRIT